MNKNLELVDKIICNVEKVVIGRKKEITNIVKGVLANGHILIEDVPGVGKTTLVKTISKSLDLSYNRLQFTPDLLPTDITGVSIYNQRTMEFEFKEGPIFSNIILADEINRASPKTQSALLQAMEEKQISEGNITYKLQEPFIVLATQNPLEYEGTFPLPEAQLDRFIIKTTIGYPDSDYESKILDIYKDNNPLEEIKNVLNKEQLLNLQRKVREIEIRKELNDYIVKLINATRNNSNLVLGGSVRASMALMRISQATALINDREYVIPEDIKENIKQVLSHRIILSPRAKANRVTEEDVIEDITKIIPVPKVR